MNLSSVLKRWFALGEGDFHLICLKVWKSGRNGIPPGIPKTPLHAPSQGQMWQMAFHPEVKVRETMSNLPHTITGWSGDKEARFKWAYQNKKYLEMLLSYFGIESELNFFYPWNFFKTEIKVERKPEWDKEERKKEVFRMEINCIWLCKSHLDRGNATGMIGSWLWYVYSSCS